MKFKKLVSSVIACTLTLSMLPFGNSSKNGNIKQILSDLSLSAEPMNVSAASGSFRRPLSNDSPMWIVHIDSWNYPDPEKIIDLVPEDILPYVVFNISLSINWSSTEHKWLMVQDGIETARAAGFTRIAYYINRKPNFIEL